jgi:hypothetical protein
MTQLEFDFEEGVIPLEPRAEVLRTAEKLITHARAEQHGSMKANFECIGRYWGIHLGREVTANDVAIMMALLKVARLKSNPANMDNWIDACGYLALGGELNHGNGNGEA